MTVQERDRINQIISDAIAECEETRKMVFLEGERDKQVILDYMFGRFKNVREYTALIEKPDAPEEVTVAFVVEATGNIFTLSMICRALKLQRLTDIDGNIYYM